MKIVVYGGRGWIGSMFVAALKQASEKHEVIVSDLRVDARNQQAIIEEIRHADRVVCMIGRTSGVLPDGTKVNTIDYLEGNVHDNVRDNLYAPLVLALICTQLKKHLSYLGTGCIFSWDTNADTKRRVSEEEHADFFGSSYSVVKGFTDSLMHLNMLDSNVLNWRIRMPFVNYNHEKNFITKIVGYKKINSNNNSMTYLNNLIPVMVQMCLDGIVGTWNMVNPGFTNHRNILQRMAMSHFIGTYEYVEGESTLGLKSKRSSNIMDARTLNEYCASSRLNLMSIEEAVEDCIQTWQSK